ncbi:MAG: quinohemoprotein amine dehydrogenase subunit alpha [Acidobacteria bacterium]|nr:quinohemoprotein amine dehydrogenase subunit alpha [Acidobacteriota bacterium]
MRLLASLALALLPLLAQQSPPPANPEKDSDKKEAEDGFPVTSDLVKKSCGPCHPADEKGRLSRISFRRTTPEGWQQTIKRMVSLVGVKLDPEEARQTVRYLANHHGLAPEEAKPGMFEVERRMIDYKYPADNDTEQTCIKCHSFGRVLLQRRTRTEWELLLAMHRGYYPLIDFQAFRRTGPPQTEPGPDGRPPDNRHPMDKAIAHLSSAFPLRTAEWSSWSANVRPPKLEGRWMLSGHQTGKGPVYGEVEIHRNPSARDGDEFVTSIRYLYARTGQNVRRTGKAILYTGFQWRGRSMEAGAGQTAMREVMFLERNQREMSGRWFSGAYDETGIDVRLERAGKDAMILGLDRNALQTGARDREVSIYGANLPLKPQPSDVDFGPGVTLKRITQASENRITVLADVAADAKIGPRDLVIAGALKANAAVVFDKVDAIKVRPPSGMARNGGNRFPKMYQQFEAVGYSNGPDGKPDTKDDLELGMLDVAWSVEEYTATFGDDDKEFAGSLDAEGLFTPAGDGPNPSRSGNRNNVGDLWIVATYTTAGSNSKPLRARAHLLVTVPLYIRFEQPEVSQ